MAGYFTGYFTAYFNVGAGGGPSAAAAALLPGAAGRPETPHRVGPVKRPGQVFGEQDPLSPFLTSRADAPAGAPGPVVFSDFVPAPAAVVASAAARDAELDPAIAALLAFDELWAAAPLAREQLPFPAQDDALAAALLLAVDALH